MNLYQVVDGNFIVRQFVAVCTLTLCPLLSSQVMAKTDNSGSKSIWGIGVGGVSNQKAYKSIDRKTTLFPLLHLDNQYFRFFGTGIEIKLPDLTLNETQQLNFGLIGQYEGAGYKSEDAPALAGMAERKDGVWAGIKVEWQTSFANVAADWKQDLSGNSNGQQVKLDIEKTWLIANDFRLTPHFGVTWHDRKYIDYYYGVRSDEVRAGRAVYKASSGFDFVTGVQSSYAFNKNHSVMFDMEVTRLSSEAIDSPLTDRSTETRFLLGYVYYF